MEENNEITCENGQESKSVYMLYSLTNLCDCVYDLSSLTCLVLIGHRLDDLDGIETLRSLEELWIVDAGLHQKDVEPLKRCAGVKRLYLYDNKLEVIPDLGCLSRLTRLWLSDNQITSFNNLETLSAIKEINLSNNNITHINVEVKNCIDIEVLNLSGNPLHDLVELAKLANFRKLHSIIIADPLCRVSPVTLLANIRRYLIFVIPNLLIIESTAITDSERKNAVSFYKRQIQYYRLKLHNLLAMQSEAMKDEVESMEEEHELIWSALHRHGPQECRSTNVNNSNYIFWERKANVWRKMNDYKSLKQRQLGKVISKTVQLELEYSGNITFDEIGLSANKVYEQFKQKMDSYVCSHLKRVVEQIDLLNVWSVTGPFSTISQKLRIDDIFDQLHICHPVHELCETPLDFVIEFIFQKNISGNLQFSKCLVNSDPLVSCPSLVHDQLLSLAPTLRRSRLLVLCAVTDSDLWTHVIDRLPVCPTCSLQTCTEHSSMVPLYFIHFKYKFVDYFKALKNSIPILNMKSQTFLPKRIEQQSTNVITNLVLNNVEIKSLEIPPMPSVTTLDLSYNLVENCSWITSVFPKLTYLNLGYNRIRRIDNIQRLIELNHLILKWNFLSNFSKTLTLLKEVQHLKKLNLSNNPFRDLTNKEHELYFICSRLSDLHSYNEEPLPRHYTTSTVVVQDNGRFPVIPWINTSSQALTVMWKCDLVDNNGGNYLGKVDNKLVSLKLCDLDMTTLVSELSLNKLRWLNLSSNLITNYTVLEGLSRLVEVDLTRNIIESFSPTNEVFKYLSKLNLSHNYIPSLTNFQPLAFPHIKLLDVSHNLIQSLEGVRKLKTLVELYVSHNRLKDRDTLSHCKTWKKLRVLDISFNPMTKGNNVREACLYYVSCLDYLNGQKVEAEELKNALVLYGGSLDVDYLLRVFSQPSFCNLTNISLPDCSIKKVQMPPNTLTNVTSVCLDNNQISSLEWIQFLPRIERVSLSHNFVCRYSSEGNSITELSPVPNSTLCSLLLDHNCIRNLVPLQLHLFPQLKLLALNNNQISYLSGLNSNNNLEVLILDRNKLTFINPDLTRNLGNLRELNVEHNSLTKLDFIAPLISVQLLYLGHNKIVARSTLGPLGALPELKELTLHGNPLMRKNNSYGEYLPFIPSLQLLEGCDVTTSEND